MRVKSLSAVTEYVTFIFSLCYIIRNIKVIKMTTSTIPFNLAEAKDTGFFIAGTTQTGKTTLAKHIVQQIIDSGTTVYVLDVSKAWLKDTPISNAQEYREGCNDIEITPTVPTVLDISDLGYKSRIKFVNAFTKMVYGWHRRQGHKKAPFGFIFYEESHIYFPNGCYRSPERYAPCIDLVTVGANYNLRYGFITQCPALVDKTLVKITQQRYFGRTTEPNDLNYVKQFIGKQWIKEDNPERIQRFNKGQFLYCYNEIQKIQSKPYVQIPGTNNSVNSFSLNGQSTSFNYFV
jgi:DNA helicase HerA-like ATPase